MEFALGRPETIASMRQLCCCVDMAWATLMYGARTTCEWCVKRKSLLGILTASTSKDKHSNDPESLPKVLVKSQTPQYHDHSYFEEFLKLLTCSCTHVAAFFACLDSD